jgi:hypothetical protein
MITRLHARILFGLALLAILVFPALALQTTPAVQLTVGRQSCTLVLASVAEATAEATSEATPEAEAEATAEPGSDLPTLTLGDDCEDVAAGLVVPANGTLWLSLMLEDDPDIWLPLSEIEGDENPPQLDRRGRYFGCEIPTQGEQFCLVQVEVDETAYRVMIPVQVAGAFFAPTSTAAPAATAAPTATPPPAGGGASPPAGTQEAAPPPDGGGGSDT